MLQVAWCLSGLGGHVYSLAAQHSLHSPPLIAAGCGDATIRLFKLSPPQDTHLSLLEPVGPLSQARPAAAEQPVHQGLQIAAEGAKLVWSSIPGMVTALQWHPQQQDVLAFGCDNGSVSLLELASQRVHSFSTRHKAPVTACCWMPLPSSSGASWLDSCTADNMSGLAQLQAAAGRASEACRKASVISSACCMAKLHDPSSQWHCHVLLARQLLWWLGSNLSCAQLTSAAYVLHVLC